jgi:hypothetical protein
MKLTVEHLITSLVGSHLKTSSIVSWEISEILVVIVAEYWSKTNQTELQNPKWSTFLASVDIRVLRKVVTHTQHKTILHIVYPELKSRTGKRMEQIY